MTGASIALVIFNPSTVEFSIYSSAGDTPGTLLASLGSLTFSASGKVSAGTFDTSAPTPGLTLTSGTEYWFVLTILSSNLIGWESAGTSLQPYAFTASSTSGFTPDDTNGSQFEIDGNPLASAIAPEPTSIALLGTGVLGVAGVLRKRFV